MVGVGGWWRLAAVGNWWLVVVGSWQRLVMVRSWWSPGWCVPKKTHFVSKNPPFWHKMYQKNPRLKWTKQTKKMYVSAQIGGFYGFFFGTFGGGGWYILGVFGTLGGGYILRGFLVQLGGFMAQFRGFYGTIRGVYSTPPPLYKLHQSPKLIRSLRLL